MQKRQSIFLGLVACCLVTTFVACKKEAKNAATDITAANDNTMAESNYNDATNMVDASYALGVNFTARTEAGQNGARIEDVLGTGINVTVDTLSTTRKITIDFGATDYTCLDQRKRRGKIIATWVGTSYRTPGTVITITFDNYFVNGNQIMGTHKTTNQGLNNAGNLVYKIEVDGSIIKANGGTITWKSTRYREWTAGVTTPLNPLDDAYSITGSASGTTAAGGAYTINITQPLVRKMSCYWFESGKIELTPAGGATWSLDYGTTGCDAKATVAVGPLSYNIDLF